MMKSLAKKILAHVGRRVQGIAEQPWTGERPSLVPGDLVNPHGLIRKLADSSNPVSGNLPARLPAGIRGFSGEMVQAPSSSSGVAPDLIEGLNGLSQGPSLFDKARFAGIPLVVETKTLLSRRAHREAPLYLNKFTRCHVFRVQDSERRAPSIGNPLLRRITILVLAVICVIVSQASLASSPGMDPSAEDTIGMQCIQNIDKWFPLITIPVHELALDQVKFKKTNQIVVIPLKTPHAGVTAIRWHPRQASDGMDFIGFLQLGKIGAVNVLPFLHGPRHLYVTDGHLMDKLKDCEKETIEAVFGRCTECEVMEWLNVMQP
jgi:hypothetical protein